MNDAMASDIARKLRSLNEPELSLKIWHLDRNVLSFPVVQPSGASDDVATAARARYLIQTLGNQKKDLSMRIASLEILLSLSAFHTGPQTGPSRVLPIDNHWLVSSGDEILATAKAIFNDPVEDAHLRALSLGFLDLNDPGNVENIRRVYREAHSAELQFAIEQAFLEVSDQLYRSLHSSSGPVASIIEAAPEHGCVQPPDNQVIFLARFYSTRAFNDRGSVVTAARIVLKNVKSGQRFEVKNARSMGGYWSTLDGVLVFALDQVSEVPIGIYTLGMEYAHQFAFEVPSVGFVNDVPSVGHTMTVAIADSQDGKRISLPAAKRNKRGR